MEGHGDQVLVLAMEPSKLLGYRDSHILFQKHPQLQRVRITEEERQHLIDQGILITRFKNPEVAVVTARSLYKCFGHKVIKNGQPIKDDYFEKETSRHNHATTTMTTTTVNKSTKADESAHVDDELVEDHSRKSLIGKTSRSEGYSSNVPLSNQTWMHHAALAARGFNAQLHERRAGKPTFYDIHSNINQVPASYQPSSCRFEFDKSIRGQQQQQQTTRVEFVKKTNIHNTPLYRGLGKDLLDYQLESVVQSLPTEEEKEHARNILLYDDEKIVTDEEEDQAYPLALMEGQFQNAFPIHQARFNYPIPKISEPTILVDTAQSLAAQQYYLSLVYQSVNQYADPQRQQSAMARMNPVNYVMQQPIPHHPPPATPMVPMVPQPEPIVCGTILPGNQVCRRPVNRPGEKCQVHAAPVKSLADYAKAPPPVS